MCTGDELSAGKIVPEDEAAIESHGEEIDIEATSSLHELPPAPWRSLGGYLDYINWPERDRFVQLDQIIARTLSSNEFRRPVVAPIVRVRPSQPDRKRNTRKRPWRLELLLTSIRKIR
jgi:hypothetical protein